MPLNLHALRDYGLRDNPQYIVGGDDLRLDDFEVCSLLSPFVERAIHLIETADLLVARVEIQRDCIRAYVDSAANYNGTEFVQVPLPEGLYDQALNLSHGPFVPFPVSQPPVEAKMWLGQLHRRLFVDYETPWMITLHADSFLLIRSWMRGRFDPCTQAVRLRQGFVGTLFEFDGESGRSVEVQISRDVPVGEVRTDPAVCPPHGTFGTRFDHPDPV